MQHDGTLDSKDWKTIKNVGKNTKENSTHNKVEVDYNRTQSKNGRPLKRNVNPR